MGVIFDFWYSQLFLSLPYPTKSLQDQTIIITGSNTGLGFEAAKHCVRLNAAKVILTVRDLTKGDAAKAAIYAAHPVRTTVIEVWHLDLLSTNSVKEFAAKAAGLERLDAVIENAAMINPFWVEVEGFESTILANVINTELLALLLLPKLQETAIRWNVQPRLSIVVSESHFVAKFEERTRSDIFEALSQETGANMDDRFKTLGGVFRAGTVRKNQQVIKTDSCRQLFDSRSLPNRHSSESYRLEEMVYDFGDSGNGKNRGSRQ
ncbi:hypothetical protein ACEPPN_001349 [Leptodophora sp. 'Broadleaf-Isolate-01']